MARSGSMLSEQLLKSYASAKELGEPKIVAETHHEENHEGNTEETPAFRSPTNDPEEVYVENFKNLSTDEKRERIAANVSWKPTIVFNPQANKVTFK